MRLFHTTTADAASAILKDGFRDGHHTYGMSVMISGVFLSIRPANVNEGATGDQVLEVILPAAL